MRRSVIIALMALTLLFPSAGAVDERPLVVTTIAPLASIVQDAFGDSVDVVYLIPPGADPHQFQLTAGQIELLRKADVIVTTGGHLPVERKVAELKAEGTITGEPLFLEDYRREGFRYLKEHWYNEKDNPHGVWLDPRNALAIARATEKALEKVDPADSERYASEYTAFEEKVMAVIRAYRTLVEENRTAIIQTPAEQYAVEWLGIRAVASIKPEEEVPALGVDELVPTAKDVDLVILRVDSPQQLQDAARELSAKAGKPLAEVRVLWGEKPYTEVLMENSASVIRALSGKAPGEIPVKRTDITWYVAISLVVGLVLGTALGVVLKK